VCVNPRLANSELGQHVLELFVDPADAVRLTVDWDMNGDELGELFDLVEITLGSAEMN
jgi:hypothetical protein